LINMHFRRFEIASDIMESSLHYTNRENGMNDMAWHGLHEALHGFSFMCIGKRMDVRCSIQKRLALALISEMENH